MGVRTISGVIGAVVAGVLFGVAMQMMGMIAMISDMVGAGSIAVGWLIHLMMSALFGVGYGLVFMAISTRLGPNLALGVVYGIGIWLMGPMIVVPMMTGGTILAFGLDAAMPLMGHIVWGLLTGAIAAWAYQRLSARRTTRLHQPV